MGKIGDLWVKLGLKNDDLKKGLDESEKKLSGFGKGMNKLSGIAKASWAAVAAAVVAAAVKMADKFAHTSQRLGDQWDQVTAGLKASWRSFIAAVNSTDFTNLGKKLAEAFRNAKDVAASADQEFEVMNAIRLKKGDKADDLAQLRIQMTNEKLTQKERVAAAKEYLRQIKPLFKEEEDYREDHARKVKKAYLANANLANTAENNASLDYFLRNVANNADLTAALDKYNRTGGKMSQLSNKERRLVNSLRDKTGSSNLKSLATIAEYYQSTGDDTAQQVVDAIASAQAARSAFNEETRRVQAIANKAITGGGGGASDPNADRAENVAQRASDAAKSEIDILTQKYLQEKALLENYQKDTTALWEEYQANIKKAVGKIDIDEEVALAGVKFEGADELTVLFSKMFSDSALLGALGLDESAIGEAYLKRIAEAIADAETDELTESLQSEIDKAMEGVQAEILEPIQIDATPLEGFGKELKRHLEMIKELTDDFNRSVVAGISDGCQEILNQLTGVSEFNPGAILASILTPLADMAIRSGEVIMAEGVGIKAVVDGLKTLNPAFPLVAGAALIAIGSAAKAGLQALASAGASGSSTAATSYQGGTASEEIQNIATELTVHVEGRISGSDIVLSGQRTTNGWNR